MKSTLYNTGFPSARRALLLACLLLPAVSRAATLNWGSEIFSTLVDSRGQTLDNRYQIELGAFAVDFVPDETNIAQWRDHWYIFDTAEYNQEFGYFTSTVEIGPDGKSDSTSATPDAPSFEGKEMYLWIQDNAGAQPGSEWLLTRSATWVFNSISAECCDNEAPIEWSVSDLTELDTPVWGSQGGTAGGGDTTAPGVYTLQAYALVPEPSAVLLITLAAGAGLLRRRR